MPKYPRNHPLKKKPPNTPKKHRIEQPWKIREEDMPHVGEIWRIRMFTADGSLDYHYLLLEPHIIPGWSDYDGLGWTTICLENGLVLDFYMNLQLDDWTRIE